MSPNTFGTLSVSVLLTVGLLLDAVSGEANPFPDEPVEIGTGPQFLFDRYLVDNQWAIKYKKESLQRVFHQPRKHERNPILAGDCGYVSIRRDDRTGQWQMWYQVSIPGKDEDRTQYAIAYAESKDGIDWKLPSLGLHEWKGNRENNIVWKGIRGRRASGAFILDVPEKDRKGWAHLMLYRETDGMHLIGSRDGIRWDPASDTRISGIHSDTQNAIVYDPRRQEYVLFCRPKHIYRTFRGDILDTGESRRVARMTSKELWTEWKAEPRSILLPDELDARAGFDSFYGMPTKLHGSIWWGFLWPFKTNNDIHTELAFSRDGLRFDRLPGRPRLIERGPEGAWDRGMVFGGCQWVEVGDEWWIGYAGWDGPHESRTRKPGIGLAKLRKEGFVSIRGPASGGVIVTRQLRWPGGKLQVNADAHLGELKVRVSDARRKPLPGFDYDDCATFKDDGVAHEVTWKDRTIGSLAGQVIRLEFFLKNTDLYTFRATGPEARQP